MVTETRPGIQTELQTQDLLSEGVIEDLVRQGRAPITDNGAVVNTPDGLILDEFRVYIPPLGYTPEDAPRLFEDRELLFYAPNGRIRGFADHKIVTFEEKVQIDRRIAAAKQPNPNI